MPPAPTAAVPAASVAPPGLDEKEASSLVGTRMPKLAVRARAASVSELDAIPWWPLLNTAERAVAANEVQVVVAHKGERICRFGKQATLWFGVIDGLLKMSKETSRGIPLTFTGITSGAWFGEGTLLKREVYRYDIEALRTSVVAGLPIDGFFRLLETSLPFNRFVMMQLNERLGQFIAAREIDRDSDPDLRVARSLAALFHPVLYPGVGTLLRITQEELGYLVGLSRQRTNLALKQLQSLKLIDIEYGGVRVLNLDALRRFEGEHP